jgi:hypothetical protein
MGCGHTRILARLNHSIEENQVRSKRYRMAGDYSMPNFSDKMVRIILAILIL